MSLVLSPHGKILFKEYFSRVKPQFADFKFRLDGPDNWKITCPGASIYRDVASFKGSYIEASKALRMALITAKMMQ